jgi:hypothetical protein
MSQVKKIMGLTGFLDDQHGRLASDNPLSSLSYYFSYMAHKSMFNFMNYYLIILHVAHTFSILHT